jgi:endoglucanase
MLGSEGPPLPTIVLMVSLAVCVVGCSTGPTMEMDPFEQNDRLGRGVNLGNALEAPSEGLWGVTLQEEYFQLIEEAGFDAVRIPIRWSAHAASVEPFTIDPSFFERVDWAVDQALARGLAVVINMHHYEQIMREPEEHRARFLAMWEQIGNRYKEYPADLLFEVLNEPHDELDSGTWNALLMEAISVIRKTNPVRNIIVGSADWYSIGALRRLELPDEDRHIIASIHYYAPFEFTHQGAEWVSGSGAWLGEKWHSTPLEEQAITGDLDLVAAWAETNDRPVYVGEFGAYSKADLHSRARWTEFVARQATERGMSWAYWEFCSGFGVYDTAGNVWKRPLLEALMWRR